MVQSVCHFCYPFATTNVFCYQLSFIIVNCILAATTQNIKQKLKILSFVKTVKNALLIRMSLVRVQLPEPKISHRTSTPCGIFLLSVAHTAFMQKWVKIALNYHDDKTKSEQIVPVFISKYKNLCGHCRI